MYDATKMQWNEARGAHVNNACLRRSRMRLAAGVNASGLDDAAAFAPAAADTPAAAAFGDAAAALGDVWGE